MKNILNTLCLISFIACHKDSTTPASNPAPTTPQYVSPFYEPIIMSWVGYTGNTDTGTFTYSYPDWSMAGYTNGKIIHGAYFYLEYDSAYWNPGIIVVQEKYQIQQGQVIHLLDCTFTVNIANQATGAISLTLKDEVPLNNITYFSATQDNGANSIWLDIYYY